MSLLSQNRTFEADPSWYDADFKAQYLNSVTDSEKIYVSFLLDKMSMHEKQLDDPLYDQMTRDIEGFLYSLMPLTMTTSYKALGYVIRYMRFAVEKGVKRSNILLIDGSFEYAKKFIPQNARQHISYTQLQSLMEACHNPQDKVIFGLVFEGLRGDSLYELRHLKTSDLHMTSPEKDSSGFQQFSYFIDVPHTEGPSRKVPISGALYELCKMAFEQTHYAINNGEEIEDTTRWNVRSHHPLVDAPFILKRTNVGKHSNDHTSPISYHGLYVRMRKIATYKQFEGMDPDYLKFATLYESGAIYEAYRLIDLHYAEGKMNQLSSREKRKIYRSVNWLNLRKQVISKYAHITFNKSAHFISAETLEEYYG